MLNPTERVDLYIDTWNEADPVLRREMVARAWAESAIYRDPVLEGDGHAGIDQLLAAVQTRFPGHVMRRTSDVDAHNDCVRFGWALGPKDGAPVFAGIDIGFFADDGRLTRIAGFIDQAPQT